MTSLRDALRRVWSTYYTVRLICTAAGIIVCFVLYGVMQEKIMRACYGGDVVDGRCRGERFTFEMSLVLIYCTWYTLLARLLTFANDRCTFLHHADKDATHPLWYVASSLCYVSAMVLSNMALRHISYPTQVVAKSSKPIAVMILGMVIARRRYTVQKFAFVLLIVAGVVLFVYRERKTRSGDDSTKLGLALVGMSLLADGVLGGIEERVRKTTEPTALRIMTAINFFSAVFLLVGVVATREILGFWRFLGRHPEVLARIATGAMVGSLGQIFVFLMVANFGSLSTSIATTTRKFFSVLASVVFFGNALLPRQWAAAALVFSALLADTLVGRKELCRQDKQLSRKEEAVKDCDVETAAAVELEELKKPGGD